MKLGKEKLYFLVFSLLFFVASLGFYLLKKKRQEGVYQQAPEEAGVVQIYPNQENFTIKTRQNYGVNLAINRIGKIFDVGKEEMYADFVDVYKRLGFKNFRFPNGCHLSWYNWKNPELSNNPSSNPTPSVEEALKFAKDTNSEIIFEMSTLGLLDPAIRDHEYTNPCGWTVTYHWPAEDIRFFVQQYTVKRKNAGQNYINYYELGNEDWGYRNETLGRQLTASEYIKAARQVSQIIKSEAPYVKIIGVSSWWEEEVWAAQEYKNNKDFFDFVSLHSYWTDLRWPNAPEGESLFALEKYLAPKLEGYKNAFYDVPKFQKPAITEWNLACWGLTLHRNNKKFEQALYVLGNLLLQSDYNIEISNYHLMFQAPDPYLCNLIYKNGEIYDFTAPGVAFDIYKNHFGPTHVKTEVNSPVVSFENYGFSTDFKFQSLMPFSSKNKNKIYSIVINRNWQIDLSTKIYLNDYSDKLRYTLYMLSAPAYSSPIEEIAFTKKADNKEADNGFFINIPKHSAAILEIEKAACQYDYNKNGFVGIDDVVYLLNTWSQNSFSSLLQLITYWGYACGS